MTKIISVLLFISSVSFGQIHPFINNGHLLQPNQLPQVLLLKSNSILGGSCTGELVGPRVVLTAAHCCKAGDSNVVGYSKTKSVTIHPSYNKVTTPYYGYALPEIYAIENDICIIELESNVLNVTPFSLPVHDPILNVEHIIVGVGENNLKQRQYGFLNVTKFTEKGIQTQADVNYGRPGDSGGGILSGKIGQEVELLGITSLSTYQCGESKGANVRPGNSYSCSTEKSTDPEIVFVPPRTTGFASLRNQSNVSFLRDFANQNSIEICGLNAQCRPIVFEH